MWIGHYRKIFLFLLKFKWCRLLPEFLSQITCLHPHLYVKYRRKYNKLSIITARRMMMNNISTSGGQNSLINLSWTSSLIFLLEQTDKHVYRIFSNKRRRHLFNFEPFKLQHLLKGDAYFKIRGIINLKFKRF